MLTTSRKIGSYFFCYIYFIIYYFDKRTVKIPELMKYVISIVSGGVFCTYLFEDMLRSDIFLYLFDLVSGNTTKLLMCIPYTLCIIICGVIMSELFNRIPIIKRLKL